MTKGSSIVLLTILFAPASGRTQSAWAYVPASRDAQTLGVVAAPFIPADGVVRVVGKSTNGGGAHAEARRVVALAIPELFLSQYDLNLRQTPEEKTIPASALWPDASGKIVAAQKEMGGVPKIAGIRNPLEIRIHPVAAGRNAVFLNGGIIAGGSGGPVAFLNGRAVRNGDMMGKFRVTQILDIGVVVEAGGLFYVLPRGRRTTVTTTGG